jgi:hypothetical protein
MKKENKENVKLESNKTPKSVKKEEEGGKSRHKKVKVDHED